jgi:hypothetical protein
VAVVVFPSFAAAQPWAPWFAARLPAGCGGCRVGRLGSAWAVSVPVSL